MTKFNDPYLQRAIDAGPQRGMSRLNATSVKYIGGDDAVEITLNNGVVLTFPRASIQERSKVWTPEKTGFVTVSLHSNAVRAVSRMEASLA